MKMLYRTHATQNEDLKMLLTRYNHATNKDLIQSCSQSGLCLSQFLLLQDLRYDFCDISYIVLIESSYGYPRIIGDIDVIFCLSSACAAMTYSLLTSQLHHRVRI